MDVRAYERRVQYYETDQMGVVHHSNYIRWFEEARVDFLERAGAGYKEMEAEGIISPVISVNCQYRSMARFGDTVEISLQVLSYNGVKLSLGYEVKDKAGGKIRCEGSSSHCFLGTDGKLLSLKRQYPKYHEILQSCLEASGAADACVCNGRKSR